jgi:threonine/homoserine/homoserine lactone efflux protein
MIDPLVLLAFLPAALALNLTPGADMMFCLSQGMAAGPRAAIAASGGISAGVLVHVTLAGVGLGAMLEAFPWLFGAIRWLGAAYLLWLAWRTLRTPLSPGAALIRRTSRALRDGFVVNLSNPKVILFVLAFLPQFVTPARPVLPQFLALGAILAMGGFVANALVGVFSGHLGAAILRNPRAERGLRITSSGIFAVLAARIGWEAARA